MKIRTRSNIMILLGVLLLVLGAGNVWWVYQTSHSPLDTVYTSAEQLDRNDLYIPLLQSPAEPTSTDLPPYRVDDPEGFLRPRSSVPTPNATDQDPTPGFVPDRLVIPAIHLDAPIEPIHFINVVLDGQTYQQWIAPNHFAAGWHDSSALLGLPGNTVLNGHHNGYGKVFQNLIALDIGDTITAYSGSRIFEYRVSAKLLLPERYKNINIRMENARWIMPTENERLTLITCWPADSNTHRVVIVAFPTSEKTIN